MGDPGVPTVREFLARTLKSGEAVGVDPKLLSIARGRELEEALRPGGGRLVLLEENLVDALWLDRPALPDKSRRANNLENPNGFLDHFFHGPGSMYRENFPHLNNQKLE